MAISATRPQAMSPASASASRDMFRRMQPLVILVAVVLIVVLLAASGDMVLQRRVIFGLIHLVAVVGLYIFMGNSGVLNFSSAGFMAIGAYVSALLTMAPGVKATFLPTCRPGSPRSSSRRCGARSPAACRPAWSRCWSAYRSCACRALRRRSRRCR